MQRIKRFWHGLSTKGKAAVVGVIVILLAIAGGSGSSGNGSPFTSPSPEALATEIGPLHPADTGPASPTLTPEPRQTGEASDEPIPSPKVIEGMESADIKLGLEDRGFACSGPEVGEFAGLTWTCEFDETDGSAEYIVLYAGYGPSDIYYVDATALSYAQTPDNATAMDFLGYVASVPYDDADPSAAQAWVRDNFGEDAEADFGSAHYYTFAASTGRATTLTITAVE